MTQTAPNSEPGRTGPPTLEYEFLRSAGRIINARQSRTLVLSGNIHDLFFLPQAETGGQYVPLVSFLTAKWDLPDWILLVYELNGPIRFLRDSDRDKVKDAWLRLRTGLDANQLAVEQMVRSRRLRAELDARADEFEANLNRAIGNPTVALEVLRQMCLCSRTEIAGEPLLRENLLIVVESTDMLIPEGNITQLSDADRHRVAICQDWFSDTGFISGDDAVVLLTESRSLLNHRIARLPQVLEIEVPSPDEAARAHFISWFDARLAADRKVKLWGTRADLVRFAAGLSIHALMQLLQGAAHAGGRLTSEAVVEKVEQYIQSQLGDDIVEFKKPAHRLDDLVGFRRLKEFLRDELIPRFRATGPEALPGAAVGGPIGSGKTYIFEAVAAELDMVVLVLKNIRSQWFGQTDVILERLRRVLDALAKVLIFVDEADTQFGGVGPEAHATERRLTGKIQAMMSDPRLRGRVIWLLMTARIHRLSPDIRRPGRVGDLIIPVLDPQGEDRREFLRWAIVPVLDGEIDAARMARFEAATKDYSSAGFAALRAELRAKARGGKMGIDEVVAILEDMISPAIQETRRYQALQALVNCTRRSLLPDPDVGQAEREAWSREIRELEARGIR